MVVERRDLIPRLRKFWWSCGWFVPRFWGNSREKSTYVIRGGGLRSRDSGLRRRNVLRKEARQSVGCDGRRYAHEGQAARGRGRQPLLEGHLSVRPTRHGSRLSEPRRPAEPLWWRAI